MIRASVPKQITALGEVAALASNRLGFAAACVSREVTHRVKEYYVLLMLMTGGILGTFASLDIFFLYFLMKFC